MTRSVINRSQLLYFFVAFLIFLELMPYFWWWTQSYRYIQYLCRIIVFLGFARHYKRVAKYDAGLMFIFILMILVSLIRSPFASLVLTLPLLFIPFAKDCFIREVFRAFSTIYCVFVGLALIAWVLLMMGIISPIGTIAPLNAFDYDYYTKYPLFLVTPNQFELGYSFRFPGPFDEPGMIGTFSALLLFCNSFDFKDWRTYILLISGFLSFSLFFILILFIGFVPTLLNKNKLWLVIVFLLGISFFYNKTKDDVIINHLVWERLEFNEDKGGLSGFDRTTDDAEKYYNAKRGSYEYWFGLEDYESYRAMARGSNSYQNVVMRNGMFFLFFYVLFFVLYAWEGRQSSKSFLVFVIVFISCIYQRPQVLSCAYVFLYCCIARNEAFGLVLSNKKN